MSVKHPAVVLGILFLCASARAQDRPEDRHRLFVESLKKRAAALSARSLSDVKSLEQWKGARGRLHRELRSMLGLDPLPDRTPLNVRVTGIVQREKYRIEKVVFQSLPGLYVTGNLYVPKGQDGPLPAVLYVCGHSPHPLGAKVNYQNRAAWFADHSYVTFVIDTLEFGEVAGIHHGVHDLNRWDWLSLGYAPVGTEVWNAVRALDYLESRPEVKKGAIGMTGISGGGAVTWYTAAVDDRVAAAAPVCSTWTAGSQAKHWVAAGQCDCIYFYNTYQHDFPLVAALIAPRPLLICSGRKDGDFPPDGYHEVYRRGKRIYDLYAGGDSDRIKEVDENVGHTDSPLFRKEARQWMRRWLKGDLTPLEMVPIPKEPREKPETLAVLDRLPKDAVNYRAEDILLPAPPSKTCPTVEAWKNRRVDLLRLLKENCFRALPDPVPFKTRRGRSRGGWASRYADYKDVVFQSEAGVYVRAQLLTPRGATRETPVVVYAKRRGDSIYFLDLDELLPLLGRVTVLILNPRLTEHPVSAYEYAEIQRAATWVGGTVESMQTGDILRSLAWLRAEENLAPSKLSLYGRGDMGILALYAALLDGKVDRVILRDPPASHRNGPALLNVLRFTDIPEVAAAFAPGELVFLGTTPHRFDSTRWVYRLHGDEARIHRRGSLPEALELWKE